MARRVTKFQQKPEDFINTRRVGIMILNAMRSFSKDILTDFRSTADFWVHQPQFKASYKYKGGDILLEVMTFGNALGTKYWKMANEGTTRRRVIFNPLYIPKTSFPGRIGNNTIGRYTTQTDDPKTSKIIGVYRTYRWNNGIRARKWTKLILDTYEPIFPYIIQDAINRGLAKK